MSQLPGKLRAEHARERWDSDYYVEPAECVHRLFDTVQFDGVIHDPCAGSGTIPKVAAAHGYDVTCSDLVDRGFCPGGVDFLTDETMRDNIVSNPPYRLAEAMFAHACRHVRGKVAFIVRLPFLAGQKRKANLFAHYRPSLVVILSKRPSMPPGGTDVPAKGGTSDYGWLVFSRAYFGPTIMEWA